MLNIQSQVDKQESIFPASYYTTVRLSPQGSVSSFALQNSASPQITFEILAGSIFNPYKTCLEFQLNFPATNNTEQGVCINADHMSFFQRVETLSGQGLYLVNINNCDKYSKLCSPICLNHKEHGNASNFMTSSSRITLGNGVISDDPFFDTNNTGAVSANYSVESLDVYSIRLPLILPTGTPAINTAAYQKNISIRLSDFLFDTFWSIDKDIYISTSIFLRLTCNPINVWGGVFDITNNNYISNLVSAPTNVTGMSLLVYNQANEQMKQLIKAESENLEMIIMPMTWDNTNSVSGQTQSFNFTLTPPQSNDANNRLYKMYYGLFMPNIINGTTYVVNNSSNLLQNASGVISNKLYTTSVVQQINGLQTKILNPDLNEDYHDVISQADTTFRNISDYKYNGCILTVCDTEKAMKKYDWSKVVGIPFGSNNNISVQHQFTVPQAMSVTLEHHLFATALIVLYMKHGEFSFRPIP